MFTKQDQAHMSHALTLAKIAAEKSEVPVGAVLVKDNDVIAEAFNQPITLHDPTAHAEILCLRQAGIALNNYRLVDTTLYVTLEPCSMCASALVHARVKRLVYAASDPRTGAIDSVFQLANYPQLNHQIECESGLMADESSALLRAFFRARR